MIPATTSEELLALNLRLLDSIMQGDWDTYADLCDPTLTAFEPEAAGQLVVGLPFHKFYFELGSAKTPRQATMCSPHVRIMGETAVVSYVRLNQKLDAGGNPVSAAVEETRVWHRTAGKWKHVHFHRSPVH